MAHRPLRSPMHKKHVNDLNYIIMIHGYFLPLSISVPILYIVKLTSEARLEI